MFEARVSAQRHFKNTQSEIKTPSAVNADATKKACASKTNARLSQSLLNTSPLVVLFGKTNIISLGKHLRQAIYKCQEKNKDLITHDFKKD
jgi:hypothetical protein